MLREGDIIELRLGHRVYVYVEVPERHSVEVPVRYVYGNCANSTRLARREVTIEGDLAGLAGRYVVYKTCSDGGGVMSHGGYGVDVVPDGHHVFCEKLSDHSVRVDFYQSGSFTAVITDIAPVGKAVRRWVEVE